MFNLFKTKTVYLPACPEWLEEDEANIRDGVGLPFYHSLLKKLQIRASQLQGKALSDRDVYSIERLEEVTQIISELEELQKPPIEPQPEPSRTRFQDYQP